MSFNARDAQALLICIVTLLLTVPAVVGVIFPSVAAECWLFTQTGLFGILFAIAYTFMIKDEIAECP